MLLHIAPPHSAQGSVQRGFTLVELLVALVILAVMAGLSWRGLDGLIQTRERTRQTTEQLTLLQSTLTQWQADLDAITQTGQVSAVDFDGRFFRLTRRDASGQAGGVRVVSWSRELQGGRNMWVRWQSDLLNTRSALDDAWFRASNASTLARSNAIATVQADEFRLLYFRNNSWSNPLSSAEQAGAQAVTAAAIELANRLRQAAAAGVPSGLPFLQPAPSAAAPSNLVGLMPDGIRLQLNLSPGQAVAGEITKDWVRPQAGGGKS